MTTTTTPKSKAARLSPVPISRLTDLSNDQTRMHLVVMAQRPGAFRFMTMWEHVYFMGMDANCLQIMYYLWEKIPVFVISFPVSFGRQVDRFLTLAGLVMVDGVPTLFDTPTRQLTAVFPASGPTIFTLENVPNHPCYRDPTAWAIGGERFEEEAAFCGWVYETKGSEIHHLLNGRPQDEVVPDLEPYRGAFDG